MPAAYSLRDERFGGDADSDGSLTCDLGASFVPPDVALGMSDLVCSFARDFDGSAPGNGPVTIQCQLQSDQRC